MSRKVLVAAALFAGSLAYAPSANATLLIAGFIWRVT